MNETVENLILEHLRGLRDGQTGLITAFRDLRDDVHDMSVRLTNVETNLAGIHRRLDRMDARLERVERPLELSEA